MSLRPVKFDFLERIFRKGVNLEDDLVPNSLERPLDVVEGIEDILRPSTEIQPVSDEYHKLFMSFDKVPDEESWSSEEGLNQIFDEMRSYLRELAGDNQRLAQDYLDALGGEIWPKLRPILEQNPNTAAWAKCFATRSLYAAKFIINIYEGNLALALTVAQGVGQDLTGVFGPIQPTDGAFVAVLEESLQWTRLRSEYFGDVWTELYDDINPNEDKGETFEILFPGGGCDATLWTRGMCFAPEEHITIFDTVDCQDQLWQLLDTTDGEDANIDYIVGDFAKLFADETQVGKYDLIIISGVMPYLWKDWKNAGELLANFRKLFKPHGRIVFDLSVACLSYMFVGKTFPWPAKEMFLPQTFEEAIENVEMAVANAGLETMEYYYFEEPDPEDEPDDDRPICKAGIAFKLMPSQS